MAKPKLQSSLGVVANNSNKKERSWNNGYLSFGEILKIHHKRGTADVKIYGSSDTITSDPSQEGMHSCRIGVGFAGIDEQFQKPYGEVIPLQKGMIVLVAFLKNTKEKPVIIRAFHNITEKVGEINYQNVLPMEYPITDEVEMFRYLNVSRIQDFLTVDGVGNLEVASHTKSFFVATNKEIDEETFDYEDLSVKDKKTKKTVGVPENQSFPFKFLATFRDRFLDKETNWLKLFVDATKTAFKLAKIQQLEDKLTLIEVAENGAFKVRRQLDSKSWGSGSKYTEVSISEEGKVEVTCKNNKTTKVKITDEGVEVTTEDKVEMSSKKAIKLSVESSSINMTPSSIDINSPKVNIN